MRVKLQNISPKNIRGKTLFRIFDDLLDAMESYCKQNLSPEEAKKFFVSVEHLKSNCVEVELSGSIPSIYNQNIDRFLNALSSDHDAGDLPEYTYQKLESFRSKTKFHGIENFSFEQKEGEKKYLEFESKIPFPKKNSAPQEVKTLIREEIAQTFRLVGILENEPDQSKITLRPIEGRDITTVVSDQVFHYTKAHFGRWFNVRGDKLINSASHRIDRLVIKEIEFDPSVEYYIKNILPTIKKERFSKFDKNLTASDIDRLFSGVA